MRILINLAPLKSGGGQNVALNLLVGLQDMHDGNRELVFLVARDSAAQRFLLRQGRSRFHVAPRNPLVRVLYERFKVRRLIRSEGIDVVYSYFGFGLYGPDVKQVCGSADSNLYYPEVDFWSHYKGFARLKKYLIDQFRLFGVRHCAGVVFENEAILARARRLYGIRSGIVVKPSIADYPEGVPFVMPRAAAPADHKGLFLCGWQPNKNFMRIPDIARELRRRGRDWHFIFTASPDGGPWHRAFVKRLQECGVTDCVSLVGPVPKEQLASLYSQVDFVFLLSKLESFSNNIIEAWSFGRPLVVAAEEWAEAICGDGALYVERDSVSDIARLLERCASEPDLVRDVVSKGRQRLARYPSIAERIEQELRYVEHVAEAV